MGILLYQTDDDRTRIEVRTDRETVWLSLNQMADLFQHDKLAGCLYERRYGAHAKTQRRKGVKAGYLATLRLGVRYCCVRR